MDDMQRFINEHNLRLREGAQGFMSREFSKHEWAAPAIQEAGVFKKYCHHLGLMGATIEEITTVGFGVGPIDGYSISHFARTNAIRKIEPPSTSMPVYTESTTLTSL